MNIIGWGCSGDFEADWLVLSTAAATALGIYGSTKDVLRGLEIRETASHGIFLDRSNPRTSPFLLQWKFILDVGKSMLINDESWEEGELGQAASLAVRTLRHLLLTDLERRTDSSGLIWRRLVLPKSMVVRSSTVVSVHLRY